MLARIYIENPQGDSWSGQQRSTILNHSYLHLNSIQSFKILKCYQWYYKSENSGCGDANPDHNVRSHHLYQSLACNFALCVDQAC